MTQNEIKSIAEIQIAYPPSQLYSEECVNKCVKAIQNLADRYNLSYTSVERKVSEYITRHYDYKDDKWFEIPTK